VAARAIYWGAINPRRQIWVGFSTVKAIMANRLFPGFLDRLLGWSGYSSQLSEKPATEAPGNLFDPVPGAFGSHGRFDERAKPSTDVIVTSRQWELALVAAAIGVTALLGRRLLRLHR
jgi:hypothetical protein